MLFENAVFQCGQRKRCYLKTPTSSKQTRPGVRPVDREYGRQTLPCGFSLDRRCSVDGRKRYENDKCGPKRFENGANQLRFRLKTDQCGQGLRGCLKKISAHFHLKKVVEPKPLPHKFASDLYLYLIGLPDCPLDLKVTRVIRLVFGFGTTLNSVENRFVERD